MSLNTQEFEKLATLAKLNIEEAQIPVYLNSLSNIMEMISEMEKIDTSHITLHDDASKMQRLREDKVTEGNQVHLTELSTAVMAGLYLVPPVMENSK